MSYSPLLAADVNDPLGMRQGSAGWLSLALMDARNRSLRWLAALEGVSTTQPLEGFDPPAWLVGQAAWFQEFWISRCPQRNRGAQADPMGVRLASIDPRVDTWFAPGALTRLERWGVAPSASEGLRDYLAATLDTTMELLDKADGSETSLYFFRQALLHEDRVAETLAELARAMGLALPADGPTVPAPPARARREPVGFASGTVALNLDWPGWAGFFNDPKSSKVAMPGCHHRTAPKGVFDTTNECSETFPFRPASLSPSLASISLIVSKNRNLGSLSPSHRRMPFGSTKITCWCPLSNTHKRKSG